MQQPLTNPPVPFLGPIPGGFTPGTMVRIQGQVPPTADRFNVNLNCGPPPSDTAMHLSVRLLQNYIARNSLEEGNWGSEEDSGDLPIAPGQRFEILILCDPGSYKVAINGNHFCEFRHRIPFQKVTDLAIDGDVALGLIAFEGGASAPPPLMGGGPDFAQGYGPPAGQYGPPSGQYGPPPGQYGPSPAGGAYPGYGPPRPPGHQEESGFDNFLETAGTVIAGAFSSGMAQNLLGGLTGGGGQGQQQRFQPPQPPPQPQQPLFPVGGQGSVGGLGSIGSLLENFAGQVLAPKKSRKPKHGAMTVPLANQPPPMGMHMPLANQPPPMSMPMPSAVPLPPPYMSHGPPPYMPSLPTGQPLHPQVPPYRPPPTYIPPPMPGYPVSGQHLPRYPVSGQHLPGYPVSGQPLPGYPVSGQPLPSYGPQVVYPHKKMKKSKLKKAMKYGLPIAGVGVGAYALGHAMHKHSSSSSSSSSDSD